jgi:hypothetical protein
MRKRELIISIVIFMAGFGLSELLNGQQLSFRTNAMPSIPASPISQDTKVPDSWDYRVISKHSIRNAVKIDEELNLAKRDGFGEIFSVTQSSSDSGLALTVILRRPAK